MKSIILLLISFLNLYCAYSQIGTFEKDLKNKESLYLSIADKNKLFISSFYDLYCLDSLGNRLWYYSWKSNGSYPMAFVRDLKEDNVALVTQGEQYCTEVQSIREGAVQWRKNIKGQPGSHNIPKDAVLLDDSLYIVASSYEQGHGGLSPLLIKLASNGDSIFTKEIPGAFIGEIPMKVFAVDDTLTLFTDSGDGNNYLIKLTKNGSLISRTLLFNGQLIYSIAQSPEGNFILLSAIAENLSEYKIIKIDRKATLIWERSLGQIGSTKMAVSTDGSIALLQEHKDANLINQVFFVKFDSEGHFLHETLLGSRYRNSYKEMMPWAGGGFIILSDIQINDNFDSNSRFLYKTDSNGRTGSPVTFTSQRYWISGVNKFSWGDFDNDNDPDIYLKGKLFENINGEMTEIIPDEITNSTRNPNTRPSDYAFWGDMDNRNGIDLYIPKFEELYLNQGNKKFDWDSLLYQDDQKPWSYGATWIDYNNDGYLDIFLEVGGTELFRLYENQGNNTFKRSNFINFPSGGSVKDFDWVDYDSDSDLDLFIVLRSDSPFYYTFCYGFRNEGNGNFTDITNSFDLFKKEPQIETINWVYLNDDPYIDAITNNSVFAGFYLNSPQNIFTKEHEISFGVITDLTIMDIDNDSDPDLYLNGNREKNLYINYGQHRYSVKADFRGGDRSPMFIDYDMDGDLDYIYGETGEIFTNDGNDNKWLKVKLQGEKSNSSGIGVQISVKARVGSNSRWIRIQNVPSVVGSNLNSPLLLGLGDAVLVDSLIVVWPSGCIQYLKNISPNSIIEITENCFSKSPEVIDTLLCEIDDLVLYAENGTNFNWYTSLNSDTPVYFENPIHITNITKDTVLFVVNADSSSESRRAPVFIKKSYKPIAKLDYKRETDPRGFIKYSFRDTSMHSTTRQWIFESGYITNQKNPIYYSGDNKPFVVKLVVSSACGTDSISETIGVNDVVPAVFGNPINEQSYITFKLLTPSSVQLSLVHSIGEIIPLYNEIQLPAGSQVLNLNGMNLLKLHPGIYTLLLEINRKPYPLKVVILN